MKIENSTIFITGANRGIGFSLVKKALEKGAAKIYATYRSESDRSVLENLSERVVPIHLDLNNKDTIADLSNKAPSIDILVNNAGIFSGTDVLEDTEQQLRDDLETNVFGTLSVTKALLPSIKKERPGAIANVLSVVSLAAMPSFGGYCASKAALHSITQSLRGKLKTEGISVYGIYPGPVETRMTDGLEMDKTPVSNVAEAILSGVENGDEEIFPDNLSEQVGPLYLSSPKQLEENFAAF